jgi:MOSC domain-containing protein YiiM
MTARISGLQLSGGGVPKIAVDRADVQLTGLVGDWQRNRKYHGGADRALCLYSADLLEVLRQEGHDVVPGALGENVTISGLDWALLRPGARVRLGGVDAEVTSFAVPCRTIAHVFQSGGYSRINEKRHAGWSRVYVRIVREGTVSIGDPVVVRR